MADPKPRVEPMPQAYQGVSVDHPSIVSSIKTMAKQGKKVSEIMRVVGMPKEVVERHAPHARKD